jgi:NADPH2:quinone reductase
MRAFVIKELAHPSKITLSYDASKPVPGKNQVLVDIYSAGLNFFDVSSKIKRLTSQFKWYILSQILQSQGTYQSKPPLPFTLGTEFAGRIDANSPIPEGCPYKPGDRVFGAALGAFAEKVAADWNGLLPLPDNITFDQGAGRFTSFPLSTA